MALTVSEGERRQWTVFTVAGELDLVTASTVRQHVHDAVASGRRRIVLDLSRVDFCDSSGVGVLIAARRLIRSCAGELRLVLPADGDDEGSNEGNHVGKVFTALGVRRLFEIFHELDAAVSVAASPLEQPA